MCRPDAEEQDGYTIRVMNAYVKALEQEGTERTEVDASVPSVCSCSKGQRAVVYSAFAFGEWTACITKDPLRDLPHVCW
jgi:hypothetical protein